MFESLFPLSTDAAVKPLGVLCEEGGGDIQTGPFGSQLHASDYVSEGVPSIMPKNIGDNRVSTEDIAYITEEDAERLSRYRVKPGDIVYSRRGDVEKRALIRSREDGWLCGTGCLRVRPGEAGLDSVYLSYYLAHPSVRNWIVQHAIGATMPNLNTSILSDLPVVAPPEPTQKRIAHILGTFDDKIELNRQMNRTLEAIARATFKSWFVDFDPVHAKAEGREPVGMDPETAAFFPDSLQDSPLGRIPEGWEVQALGEAAEVVDCLHSQKPQQRESGRLLLQVYNVGQHGDLDLSQPYWVSEGNYTEWTRRIELVPGDLVITKTGRVGAVAQIPPGVRAALGRNMVGIRGNVGVATPRFLRCLLISDWMRREIERLTSDGTILRSLHVKAIEKLRLALPPFGLLERFESAGQPLLGLAEANAAESSDLGQTRDTLLPRLLSGSLKTDAAGKT